MINLLCVARKRHLRQQALPLSIRIRNAILFPALAMAVMILAGAGLRVMVPTQATQIEQHNKHNTEHSDQQAATAALAGQLMKMHGCWGREAPPDMRGQIPGGVVLSLGDKPIYSEQDAVVGAGLDHQFKHTHPEVTVVYGFCRGRLSHVQQ